MDTTVTVTYFHHAGFTVALQDTLLVFDYWRGENEELKGQEIRPDDLKGYRHVLVFVTSDRPDHFDPVIYTWENASVNITYLAPGNCPKIKKGKRMNVGDDLKIGECRIRVFSSSDRGVSYLVEAGGLRVFHAGTLNLWHWREESPLSDIIRAENDFYEAMAPLEKEHIDVAMFPLDPRMGGLFDAGANHFVMSVKPRVFIPMHWHGRKEVALDYARRGRTRYTEIFALTLPREQAEIRFGDTSLTWKILPPPPPVNEVKLDSLNQDDPFAESDLPVQLEAAAASPAPEPSSGVPLSPAGSPADTSEDALSHRTDEQTKTGAVL